MKLKSFTLALPILLFLMMCLCFIGNTDTLENRKLATFQMVINPDEKSVIYQDSVLERFEAAMKDQIYFRSNAIALFLQVDSKLSRLAKDVMMQYSTKENQYSYTSIGEYALIDGTDYVINLPDVERVADETIQIHVDQMERLHQLFPGIRFYSYYVTQANETGWFNDFLGNNVPNLYSQVEELLPGYVKSDRFKYEDLNDYEHCHYASDHHWNHYGARRGYEDIYSMMQEDLGLSLVKIPVKEWNFSELFDFKYHGSFARRLGKIYAGFDEFAAFEYELPNRDVYAINPATFDEIPLKEIGLFNEYVNGDIDTTIDHYIAYYGKGIPKKGDVIYGEGNALYLIRNKNMDTKHNLLIYGDSYNRAIRDVLAAHFGTTLYFQRDILENYDDVFIDQLIEKYNIDVVLFGGNSSIWTTDSYVFDFSTDVEGESE